MKYNLNYNIDIDNKKLFKRYLPSVIILLVTSLLIFWNISIIKSEPDCTNYDVSGLLQEEDKNITINLINELLVSIENGKYKQLRKVFDESIDYSTLKNGLQVINKMIPEQAVQNITITEVTVETAYEKNYKTDTITCIAEVNYPYSDFAVKMSYRKSAGNAITVDNFNVSPKKDIVNMFNACIKDATFGAYISILFMILILTLILSALILCINTDINKKKWLWIIFIIIGFFHIEYNWTAQAFDFNIFGIRLLGVGLYKSCFSPLMLYLSIPIGAIVFLIKYYRGSFNKDKPQSTEKS